MKTKKKEIIILTIIIIIQTIFYIVMGMNKCYIHMDEGYSLGLANYDKVEIQDSNDFYNTWHSGKYYEDYLAVQDKDQGKYAQVYENQKNDVHPPLYYLLLRIFMGFSVNQFSIWPGIILNIIIYSFVTIFMYLITQKIFKSKEKAIMVSFASSIILASLTTVIYIRMYALSTLNILITTFLHMKLLEKEEIDTKLLITIGITALVGSLTHYYYLFFLAMMYILFVIKYIKEKKIKHLILYTITMVVAGGISLAIFPYSIKHMFFGYRGQGAISKLTNISAFINSIRAYLQKIDYYCFGKMWLTLVAIILAGIVYGIIKRKTIKHEKNKYIKIILLPTLFYFIIVSIASPWIELRYVMPICGLIFVLIIYTLNKIYSFMLKEKERNLVLVLTVIMIITMPIILNLESEGLYLDKKEIVEQLSGELNIPTIYWFNSQNNRFLDDIYLFSILNESYVAKDLECTEENIKQILDGKDVSKGIIVFINEGQENDDLLQSIKETMNFTEWKYLKRLNACDVYHVK